MIALSERDLDVAAVVAAVGDAEHGGTAVFVGTTRREASARELLALDYEAHPELAVSEMEAIVAEAAVRFGARAAVAHRTGRVPVGGATVVVAASARGRDEAFAASRYVIDELKARVPIWKRAVYADGEREWLAGA